VNARFAPQDPNDEPASVLLERIRAEKGQPSSHPQHVARGERSRRKHG
jgi:hypothetical protein